MKEKKPTSVTTWMIVGIGGFILLSLIITNVQKGYEQQQIKLDPTVYPFSDVTYATVDSYVGCKSKLSDDKKEDIFNTNFKNHWMTWAGEVVLAEADNASLNIDGRGTQDLQVDFNDKRAGYDLVKGSRIKVQFLMKSAGGCFLPFSGKYGTIIVE